MEPDAQQPNYVNQSPVTQTEPTEPAPPTGKKRLLWLIVAILTLLILAVGGSILWSSSQKKQYSDAANSYEKEASSTFTSISGNPQDTEEYKVYLEKSVASLEDLRASRPNQPKLLWLSPAPEDKVARVNELSDAAANLKTAMQEYRMFLIYRDGVLEAVKSSIGKISAIDQMRESKTRVEATRSAIRELKPPKGLESHQQIQISTYDNMVKIMNEALAAYDAGNTKIYDEKITQLAEEASSISLPKTAAELLDMHQYYDAMTEYYEVLEKLVK